jgi:hypothetical protein
MSTVRGFPASAAAVTAFFMAAVLPAATWPLIDGDVWWHLRAGREVLAGGTVPREDTWSILGAGREWISQDWLANTFMAAIHDAGERGATFLSIFFGLAVVLAFAVLWRAIRIRNPETGWASRVVWLALGLVIAAPILGVRVQVLDLLFGAIVLLALIGYVADRRRRWLVVLPLTALIWANAHAGWPLLFLLGGAVVAGESLDRLRGWERKPVALTWRQVAGLVLALVAAFGALAVNPNGIALWTYPLTTIGLSALGQHIAEWFSVAADPYLRLLYGVFVAVAVIPTLVLGWGRLRTAEVLIIVGLAAMAAYAVRFFLVAGPLVCVYAAAVLTPRLAETAWGRRLQPSLERLAERREGARALFHVGLAGGLVTLGLGVSLLKVLPQDQTAAEHRAFPAAAVVWLDANDPGERLFNQYEWGGYLGFQRPERLVFVDGRADVYGQELLLEYAAIIGLAVDPQVALDEYRIDHVVFPPDTPFGGWMDGSAAWARAYADSLAVVWVRRP